MKRQLYLGVKWFAQDHKVFNLQRQNGIMESGYHLQSTYSGVNMRIEWNNSSKHLTQRLTPTLCRRFYDYRPKFTDGESMA